MVLSGSNSALLDGPWKWGKGAFLVNTPVSATGIYWSRTREAAKHPAVPRTAHPTPSENLPAPNVESTLTHNTCWVFNRNFMWCLMTFAEGIG